MTESDNEKAHSFVSNVAAATVSALATVALGPAGFAAGPLVLAADGILGAAAARRGAERRRAFAESVAQACAGDAEEPAMMGQGERGELEVKMPLRRIGRPEVAAAVAFLAGPDGSSVRRVAVRRRRADVELRGVTAASGRRLRR